MSPLDLWALSEPGRPTDERDPDDALTFREVRDLVVATHGSAAMYQAHRSRRNLLHGF